MSVKSGNELYVRLVNLRDSAGERLYERLNLADKLLSDHAWVEAADGGGGDESRAIDRLEDTAFGDICGALSLPEMLEILHRVPNKETWKKNRYNLRKMHAEMVARNKASTSTAKAASASKGGTSSPSVGGTPAAVGGDGTPQHQQHAVTPEDEVKRLKQENREKDRKIADLERQNRKLRVALKRLQAAVTAMQAV